MDRIAELDGELSRIFSNFEALADELEFERVCELSEDAEVDKQDYAGIYKIDIRVTGKHETFESWAEWFCAEWVRPEYKMGFVPNPRAGRLKAHTELGEWVPIYIGKASSIAGRIRQHLNYKLSQPTTALKIRERKNMAAHRFRLSTIKLEVENYDLIMPRIESALRDKYNPILGRQ
ncbi:MAG: GIY-YIG nuclease family protein [Pseudomonadota bacterium]